MVLPRFLLGLLLLAPAWAKGLPTDEAPTISPAPRRIQGLAPQVAAREKTVKERWEDLSLAIEEAKKKDYSLFPVMSYAIEGRQKLPSHIFICSDYLSRKLVEGVLQAVLPEGWRSGGEYWVTSQKEALREFSRVLKTKDKSSVKDLRERMEEDLSGGTILIYHYKRLGYKRLGKAPRP